MKVPSPTTNKVVSQIKLECLTFALRQNHDIKFTVNLWEIKFSNYSKCMEMNLVKNLTVLPISGH